MTTKTLYIADDGTKFDSEEECRDYETSQDEKYQVVKKDVEAYDSVGYKLDLEDNDWCSAAYVLKVKTGEAAAALGEIMCDSNEPIYDFYNPDLGRNISERASMIDTSGPRVFVYNDYSIESLDNPNKRFSSGWYDMTEILKNLGVAFNIAK